MMVALKWGLILLTAPGRFALVLPFVLWEIMDTGRCDWLALRDWTFLVGEARGPVG